MKIKVYKKNDYNWKLGVGASIGISIIFVCSSIIAWSKGFISNSVIQMGIAFIFLVFTIILYKKRNKQELEEEEINCEKFEVLDE